jgi:predicted phosphodiesterase
MNKPIFLNVVSDLHLELSKYRGSPPPGTDVLVAAGDIGIGVEGLHWAASWGLPVVYVPGNHEFENHDFNHLSEKLHDEAAKYKDVHVLQRESLVLKGVRFVGATLWTDFEYFGQMYKTEAMSFCQKVMPEYACVRHAGRMLRVEDTLAWHELDRAWIDFSLKEPYLNEGLMETVVVTHHLPHKKSVSPRYQQELITSAFASHCDDLIGRCGHWIHGHTHTSFDYTLDETRIICNPRGFSNSDSKSQHGFKDSILIKVGD